MYELQIKTNDGWMLADLGSDNPAMNYSANNLAELKSTNNDYSQEIRLPLSPTNAMIFEYSDIPDVVTDVPYKMFDCRLYRNGCTLAGKGAKLILRGVKNEYECQIVSGNIDFFKNIKDKKVEELDLGYVSQTINDMTPSNFTQYYKYAFASFQIGGVGSISNQLKVGSVYPFAMFKPIIEKIVRNEGFSLQTNLQDVDWDNKAISICSLDDNGEGMRPFEAKATSSYKGNESWKYVLWTPVNTGSDCMRPSGGWTTIRYYSNANSVLTIKLKLDSKATDIKVNLNKIGIGHPEGKPGTPLIEHKNYSKIDEVIEIDMLEGEYINLSYLMIGDENTGASKHFDFTSSVEFNPRQTGSVPMGGKISISKNIGFNSQLDLFNAFVQLYGLTVSVDNVNKVIRAFTFDKIIENKKKATDWSLKLDVSERPKQTFIFGDYGQNNKISFVDNDKDMVQDFGIFQVKNESLVDQKDIFSIKFEAGKNQTMTVEGVNGTRSFANIPIVEVSYDDKGKEKREFKKGKPHIVEVSTQIVAVNVDGRQMNYNCVLHPRVKSFIDLYYTSLINNALSDTLSFTLNFLLTEQDIEEFDQFTPVYIDYFGAYFYVNKIVNYGAGYLTECELIRL